MSSNLSAEAILVAGAGSGIGKAVAELLLDTGYEVINADLDLSAWDNHSPQALLNLKTNLLCESSVHDLADAIASQGIKLGGLVFTVGKAITLPLPNLKPQILDELLHLNTLSFFSLVSKLLNKDLFSATSASLVAISSLVGQTGARGKIAYAASKGALDAGIKSLAMELAAGNIRVNAIAPGTLQTPMLAKLISTIGAEEVEKLAADYPFGLGFPQDIANLVLFLLSLEAKWLTGNLITIDGGFSAR